MNPTLDPKLLKKLRKQAKLTQKQLSEKSGVSYSTLTKLEQGKIEAPSVKILNNIAQALGLDIGALIGIKPTQPAPVSPPFPAPQTAAPAAPAAPDIKPSASIEFVYFDAGGVLYRWRPALQAFAERINRPLDAVLALFYAYRPVVEKGELDLYDFQLLYALKLNIDFKKVKHEDIFKNWVDDMRSLPEGHDFIREVIKHHKVGVITNIIPGFYQQFIERGLVPNLPYKAVVKSCDVGAIKPEARIYEIATLAALAEPGKILLIDDDKVNVAAASKFGWQAEWFDEYNPSESVARIIKKHFS